VTVRACQRGPVCLRCPSLPSTQYYPARLFSPSTHVFPLNQLRRAVLSGRSSRRARWRPALHVFPVRLAVLTFLISHDCGSRWRCHRPPFDGPEAPAGEECAPTIPVAESRRKRVGRIRQRRSTRRRNLRRCAGLRCASPYDDGRDHQRQRRDPADAGGTPPSRTRPARSRSSNHAPRRDHSHRGGELPQARGRTHPEEAAGIRVNRAVGQRRPPVQISTFLSRSATASENLGAPAHAEGRPDVDAARLAGHAGAPQINLLGVQTLKVSGGSPIGSRGPKTLGCLRGGVSGRRPCAAPSAADAVPVFPRVPGRRAQELAAPARDQPSHTGASSDVRDRVD